MKIYIVFIWFIVFSFQGTAQEKRIVIVSPFSALKIFSGLEVQLIPSKDNKVIVYGDYQQSVIVQQKGSTLKIKQSITSLITQEFSFVEIYFSQPTNHITASQRSKIIAKQPLEQEEITLKVREGSKVVLEIDSRRIKSNVATGGRLTLEGTTKTLDLKINSGGSCEAEKLKAESVITHVVAGGVAYVNAKDQLDARVTGGGIVRVFSKPRKQITQTTLGGKIIVND
tara:strand:+ start:3518 stop:4198 length:681 start_codon:yes stop_codon:yes gene_type:complete